MLLLLKVLGQLDFAAFKKRVVKGEGTILAGIKRFGHPTDVAGPWGHVGLSPAHAFGKKGAQILGIFNDSALNWKASAEGVRKNSSYG
jgi:hypothetical protein